MRKYEVLVIKDNGEQIRKTVEARGFKDALGMVVHNADDYKVVSTDSRGDKTYKSKLNFANVYRV